MAVSMGAPLQIDVLTVFPGMLRGFLEESMLRRAARQGAVVFRTVDLRDFAHDARRTADDRPYGGGPGMVMKPEPWGEILDGILAEDDAADEPLIIFPSPAGEVFTQRMARELAGEQQLIFGCGRYEGPDQRIFDEYAERGRLKLVSLGDYVLNGGEVATLAMIEAIARLLPGVVGNPESLVEESHEDGLLEYPSYTKPAVWRGREVPSVLLSGNHAAIAKWRREQSIERTRRVRPDLLGE